MMLMFRDTMLAFSLCAACSSSAIAQEDESRVLLLDSGRLTLKAVFDAGFRPRRVPSLNGLCELRDQDFAISVDGRGPIRIPAEWIELTVRADNEITSFSARDRGFYTLDEALEIATEHLEILGVGTEKLAEWEARQRAGMLRAANEPGPFIGVGTFSDGKWYGDRNMKAGVKIMSTYRAQAPFTLQYYAQWRSILSMNSIRREPITPPEGYEHVSMEPYRSKDDAAKGEANGPVEGTPPVAERPEPESMSVPPPLRNRNVEGASPVWPYILAAVVLAGIAVILLHSRKSNPSS